MDYLQTIDNCTSHQGHETRNIVMLKEARVGKRLIAHTFFNPLKNLCKEFIKKTCIGMALNINEVL
jgi:hypothetical protein